MSEASPKTIQTLVKDIENVLENPQPIQDQEAQTRAFAEDLARVVTTRLSERRRSASLRVSNIGSHCDRQLWYSVNEPERGEHLPAAARLKFLFGDILEQLLLFLATLAGHKVENRQAEVDISGVKGHIDATIDGELVDVKSASSRQFPKFENHQLAFDDAFGYIDQLGAYGSKLGSGQNHFLAVDKTLGKFCLDSWPKSKKNYDKIVEEKKRMLSGPLPPRGHDDVPYQASGNRKLGVACSYCPYKDSCWPGLRMFIYSGRPVFLTRVVREPRVSEKF